MTDTQGHAPQGRDPSRPLTPAGVAEPIAKELGPEGAPVGEPEDESEAEEREGTDPA